jgi:hypothetical protein
MNYELAKKLRDENFPRDFTKVSNVYPDGLPFPDLSELMEACGEGFYKLFRKNSRFYAWADENVIMREGSTPEEAVARLWLALNIK